MNLHLKLLSLMENPAVIVASAAAGSVANLRQYLVNHPGDVSPANVNMFTTVLIIGTSCGLILWCPFVWYWR